jgi:hypothetical protein
VRFGLGLLSCRGRDFLRQRLERCLQSRRLLGNDHLGGVYRIGSQLECGNLELGVFGDFFHGLLDGEDKIVGGTLNVGDAHGVTGIDRPGLLHCRRLLRFCGRRLRLRGRLGLDGRGGAGEKHGEKHGEDDKCGAFHGFLPETGYMTARPARDSMMSIGHMVREKGSIADGRVSPDSRTGLCSGGIARWQRLDRGPETGSD